MSISYDKKNIMIIITLVITFSLITYFASYRIHNSEIELLNELHLNELKSLDEENNNFNNVFLESLTLDDSATRDRLIGNYHFDLALNYYNEALNQNDEIKMNEYKNLTANNCNIAINKFIISSQNYETSSIFFNKSMKYTENINYINLINLYINLTKSGEKLSMFRYNASILLKQLNENITYSDGLVNQGNVTFILNLFYQNLSNYNLEEEIYETLIEEIEEFDLFGFNVNREP
jgi:hypothetical protein